MTGTANAVVRYVPTEYATIQTAVNDCNTSDTVEVLDANIYTEDVSLVDGVTLLSSIRLGPVIQGTVTMANNTSLEGFRIEGGSAASALVAADNVSDITIRHNIIRAEADIPSQEMSAIYVNEVVNALIQSNIVLVQATGTSCIANGVSVNDTGYAENMQIVNNTIDIVSDYRSRGIYIDAEVRPDLPPTTDEILIANNIISIMSNDAANSYCVFKNPALSNLLPINYNDLYVPTGQGSPASGQILIDPWFGPDIGAGNIKVDPKYVDRGSDNFHLQIDSPCIDAGDPNGDYAGETDIDGEPRVMDDCVDMGADERGTAIRYVPTEYTTIQAAVNDCNTGDTVEVLDGNIYAEDVSLVDGITLLSSMRPNPVIHGTVTMANNTTLEGFGIEGGSAASALVVADNVSDITIRHNIIRAEADIPSQEMSAVYVNEAVNALIQSNIVLVRATGTSCIANGLSINDAGYAHNIQIVSNTVDVVSYYGSRGIYIDAEVRPSMTTDEILIASNIISIMSNDEPNSYCVFKSAAASNLLPINYNDLYVPTGQGSAASGQILIDPWFDPDPNSEPDIGVGNIQADPEYADRGSEDFHLKSEAGRWDPNSGSWLYDDVTSPCIDAGDPHGPHTSSPHRCRMNMGAYGNTEQASKSPVIKLACCESFECAGQPNGDATCDGSVNLADLFAIKADFGTSAPWTGKECCADFTHDGNVNLADLFRLKAGFGTSGYSPSTGNQDCPP
jgi:hypothetical protein